jgi:predicted porin
MENYLMRKSLLATALIGAFAATAAFADGTVTLYGKVNEAIKFDKTQTTGLNTVSQMVIGNGGQGLNTSSRIGFKGEEDLGGGMKAWFLIETGLTADDATATSFASREGWVGLSGDFGKLGLGRGKSPYTNLGDRFDGLVDGGMNFQIWNDALLGKLISNRIDNAVRYDSKTYEGFSFSGMYGAGENKTTTTDATQKYSFGVNYGSGPLFIGGAYNLEKNLGGVSGKQNTAMLLAGDYQLDALTLGAGVQYAKVETAGIKTDRDAFMLSATYAMDNVKFKAGAILNAKYSTNGRSVANTDYTRYTLGMNYNLSKRTYTYVEYTADDLKSASGKPDVSTFGIGIIHNF